MTEPTTRVEARLSKKDCDELARRIAEIEAADGETAKGKPARARLETVEQIILVVTAVDYAYRFTFKVAPSTWKKVRGWVEKRRKVVEGGNGGGKPPDAPSGPPDA